MKNKRAVILGAGLAGLSASYHLKSDKSFNVSVIEKENSPGGTSRSVRTRGFTFDFTGHLLHLHHDYTKKLIQKLLPNNLSSRNRNASIYSQKVLTPYPFQAHTFGLPAKTVRECVNGFMEAVKKYSDKNARATTLPFGIWSQRTFGKGIHKYFMKPYNEKLWQISVKKMTAEWCGMFVPQPNVKDVIEGSKRNTAKSFGYNVTFLYPEKGGIQVLPDALAENLPVRFNTSFDQLFWKEKKVKLGTGEILDYDYLVSTVPLVEFLKKTVYLPSKIQNLTAALRWTSVLCVNIGIDRAKISDKSWIYFPEKKYIFYRVGFPMNFSPHTVPAGHSSMYVEVSYPPGKIPDYKNPAFLKRIRKDLEFCGILKNSDKITVANVIPIPYGYVLYTPERTKATEEIFKFLSDNMIFSIGRYGGWKYSFMEEAIMDGKKTAEKIISLSS